MVHQLCIGLCALVLTVSPLGSHAGMALAAAAVTTTAPTLVTPTGPTSASTPTFTWQPVQRATSYRLYLNASGGADILDQPIAPEMACAGTTCSTRPAVSLSTGSYTWRVRAIDDAGAGPWSSGMAFTVASDGGPPASAPLLVSPHGSSATADPTPTYAWNAVVGATSYALSISVFGGMEAIDQGTLLASAVCSGATCSTRAATSLRPGTYSWRVQPSNSAGTGPWSTSMFFVVTPSGAAPGQERPQLAQDRDAPTHADAGDSRRRHASNQ
jgi:hypothetical protein